MTFRLIPDDYDFNLLGFDNSFVVSAADGLARYLSVVAPPGQNYDLEFGSPKELDPAKTLRTETKLGHVTIRGDGGFTYEPNRSRWVDDRDRIDRVEFWVKIRGRAIRTTGRFAIKQGSSEHINKAGLPARKLLKPIAGYLLEGGAYNAKLVAGWLHDRGHVKSGSRLVILSASKSSEEGAYKDFQKRGMPLWNEIQSFVVNTTVVANDPRVSAAIKAATAIFIEGGNQTRYWSLWNGTEFQKALQSCVDKVPIGGSSAGMAILGGEIYLPPMIEDGVMSAEAMSNPLDVLPGSRFSRQPFLQIPFLNQKPVYLETHFNSRKRLGRTSSVLAMSKTADLAIMADEGTALSIDDKGIGTVVGKNRVYFAELTTREPGPRANSALTTGDINVFALKKKSQFNLLKWTPVLGRAPTTFKVDCGILDPTDAARAEWYNDYAEATIVEDTLSRQEIARLE